MKTLCGNPEDFLLPLPVRDHPEMMSASCYRRHLEFNVDVAKTILLMSSVVYERDMNSLQKAYHQSNSTRRYLLESEELMFRVGAQWGCKFISIAGPFFMIWSYLESLPTDNPTDHLPIATDSRSDFQNVHGPFAGAFYKLDVDGNPFMVVVFKGTSPEALQEWIIDCSLVRYNSFDQKLVHMNWHLHPSLMWCSSSQDMEMCGDALGVYYTFGFERIDVCWLSWVWYTSIW